MKIISIKNYIVFIGILMGMLFAGFVFATPVSAACDEDLGPTVATQLPSNITSDSATLNAYFSSRDACYTDFNRPQVVFEFGETSNMSMQSDPIGVMLGAKSISIDMNDLEPGESYYYRTVMYYRDTIVKGDKVKFYTLGFSGDSSDLEVIESNTIIDTSDSGIVGGSSSNVVLGPNTNNGSTNVITTSATSNSTTSTNTRPGTVSTTGGNDSNGVAALSINNQQDIMRDGEYVTYEIAYENLASDRELEDAVILVTLPSGMKYISGSNGVSYSNSRNAAIMNVRDVEPGDSGSYSVTVKVQNIRMDEVIVEAKMTYRDVVLGSRESLSAYDIDEMDISTYGAPLAAGLFASGFMPGSAFGWLIVAILLIAIIYLIRVHFWKYYWKKERPAQPKYAQQHTLGEAPRRA